MLKVVDLEMGAKILGGDERGAKEMLTMLVNTLDETQVGLLDAYQKKQYDQLEWRVHKLHGGATYCGVPKLKASANKLESLLTSQDFDQVNLAFSELMQALQDVKSAYAHLDWT
ncbi:Hpt domain-containing protein [Gammaproteobacteria bacterium]|nr:Hpt domain-containing protein [Gammaproteobacteria bacterium]